MDLLPDLLPAGRAADFRDTIPGFAEQAGLTAFAFCGRFRGTHGLFHDGRTFTG